MEAEKAWEEGIKILKEDELGSHVSPFKTAKQVLGDLVHLQHIVPDEGDVQGALQTLFPQLLALVIGVEAPMTEKKPNCRWVKHYRGRFQKLLSM